MKTYKIDPSEKFVPIDLKKTTRSQAFINYGNNKGGISIGRGGVYIPPECRCTKSEYEKSIKDTKLEIKGIKKKAKVKKKVKKVKKRVTVMYRKKEYKISKLKSGKIKVLINGDVQTNITKTLSPIYKHVLKNLSGNDNIIK